MQTLSCLKAQANPLTPAVALASLRVLLADRPDVRLTTHSRTDTLFDVAVIGAGVVGCATARRFAKEGLRVVVLEKSADVLDGASKGNSGILHTGFDAPPDSLEAQLVRAGYQEYLSIHQQLKLPLMTCGAVVVAWTPEQEAKLDGIVEQARENGVTDVRLLSRAQLQQREPQLSRLAVAAVEIPGECVIDPWSAPHMYLRQAIDSGAQLRRKTEVVAGIFDSDRWLLKTTGGDVHARYVVNCAGLFGDTLDERLHGSLDFSIKPRKGQFLVFDKSAAPLITSIILPVPSATTKGIVVCHTSYGNLLVGPTAEEQESRVDASVDRDTLVMLKLKAVELVPALAHIGITATYAGIRPATEFKDYCIRKHSKRNAVTVGGIRSTGLSAALGIARHVFDIFKTESDSIPTVKCLSDVSIEYPLAAAAERDWSRPGNGGIVCHCEWVTRREVEAALTGTLRPASLDGLKRQTRVTMGRCQGFYCSAALEQMTKGYFDRSDDISDSDN